MESYNYLGQITTTNRKSEDGIKERIRKSWSCFGKNREIFMDKNLPLSLKRQVFNQCIIPTTAYGCETWAINKQQMTKIRSMQRAMERKTLQIKLKDKIPHPDIKNRQISKTFRNTSANKNGDGQGTWAECMTTDGQKDVQNGNREKGEETGDGQREDGETI